MMNTIPRVARLNTGSKFRAHIENLGIHLPFDENLLAGSASPLADPLKLIDGRIIGNRWAIQPMEGWDGTVDGKPTENTTRRWANFGKSGAKLIWGGEAVAVTHAGRANPNQLVINADNLLALEKLRANLVNTHKGIFGKVADLLVGLQLTHSGRFARPNEKTRLEPRIAYHHPILDSFFDIDPELPLISDTELDDLVGEFIRSAKQAYQIGFDFVDIKHCHGYLGHELLSAYTRKGAYGGSFENRTRFLREIVNGIRIEIAGASIGVRLSAFDFPPFRPGVDQIGEMVSLSQVAGCYPYAFGINPDNPLEIDYREIYGFLKLLETLQIQLVNLTCGSPYYNPHIMRPAFFPPSDGYQPPEDPLVGVARQINTVATIKARFPNLALVGTGYSYLQDWLPHVAQYVVRTGMVDFVGLGRMVLAYPEMPADVLAGNPLQRKKICRTFSDCTTAPRKGLISGCYPLDPYYKHLPEAEKMKAIKSSANSFQSETF